MKKEDVPQLENPGLRSGTTPLQGHDMAVALERVGEKIRNEDYRYVVEEGESYYEVLIDVSDLSLGDHERRILSSTWFSSSDCIGSVPWDRGLVEGGRHRLAACFEGKTDAELPVYVYQFVENMALHFIGPMEEKVVLERSLCALRALEVLEPEFWKRNRKLKIMLQKEAKYALIKQSEIDDFAFKLLVNVEVGNRYPFLAYDLNTSWEKDEQEGADSSWWQKLQQIFSKG